MPAYAGANRGKITNLPTCGGNKKAGLPSKIGVPINILMGGRYIQKPPNCCNQNPVCGKGIWGVKTTQVQNYFPNF
jgi:hypothetical protein